MAAASPAPDLQYVLLQNEDYRAWNEQRKHDKQPMQLMAYRDIQRWTASGGQDDALIEDTTFRHLVNYLRAPAAARRETGALHVALGDVGYTQDELVGKTALEIAQEIVARGVADDSDSD